MLPLLSLHSRGCRHPLQLQQSHHYLSLLRPHHQLLSSQDSLQLLVPISTLLLLHKPAYHLDFKLQAVLFFQAFCPSQVSLDFPRTLHSHPCKNCSIMQLHSQHYYSRSIQLQLWKAIQLSRMGFLVFLQRQEHHSLCNQACPKVVGSEYNLHLPLEYHQNCLRTAVNKLTNVNFSKNQIIRMRIILGKLGCFKTPAFLKVLSMNTPLV